MDFTKAEAGELAQLLKGTKYAARFTKLANKKPITVASRKAKGRDFQKQVADIIAKHLEVPITNHFDDNGLIACRPMGQTGVDIIIRPPLNFDYSIEVKNQNAISLGDWWKQCANNMEPNRFPLLVIKSKNLPEPLFITNEAGFFDKF